MAFSEINDEVTGILNQWRKWPIGIIFAYPDVTLLLKVMSNKKVMYCKCFLFRILQRETV